MQALRVRRRQGKPWNFPVHRMRRRVSSRRLRPSTALIRASSLPSRKRSRAATRARFPKPEPSDSAPASQESSEPPAQAAPAPDDPGAIQPTSDGTAPKSSLASTGATVLVPMIVVIVALVAGAVLLMRRRGLKDDDADGVDDADGGTGD